VAFGSGKRGHQLGYDFDNGTVDNDAWCRAYARRVAFLCEVGVGLKKDGSLGDTGFIAGGDSGGPGFINGQIAGIHSWGGSFGCGHVAPADITCTQRNDPRYIADQLLPPSQRKYSLNNSSYGDIASDVRAGYYTNFINYHLQYGAIPEPSMIGLFGIALLGFGLYRRRRA
jgi:hypothetical protein